MKNKIQIAREIFLKTLETMKETLSLLEFKLDKNSKDYKYAKKKIMDYTYGNLLKLYKILEVAKVIEKCECKSKLRQGYNKSCKRKEAF